MPDHVRTKAPPDTVSEPRPGEALSPEEATLGSGRFRRLLRLALLCLLYVLVSSAVLDAFVEQWALGDRWRPSRLSRTLDFETPRPIVYRVLTPWIVNGVSALLPEAMRTALAERARNLRRRYPGLREGNDVEYGVAYYLTFLALLGTLLVWRANLLVLDRGSPLLAGAAPPLAMLAWPLAFMEGGFLYDAPELLLVSLALGFFLRSRWLGFYAVLPLCVLNKEADVVLPIWFVAAYLIDRDRRSLVRHGLISLAVAAPPFLLVRWWFRDAPALPITPRLWRLHLDFLLEPSTYWSWFEPYASHVRLPQGFNVFNLLVLAAIVVLAARARRLHLVLAIFAVTVLVFLPFFLIYGYRDEIRVFAPAFPALVLLAAHGLREAASESGSA